MKNGKMGREKSQKEKGLKKEGPWKPLSGIKVMEMGKKANPKP